MVPLVSKASLNKIQIADLKYRMAGMAEMMVSKFQQFTCTIIILLFFSTLNTEFEELSDTAQHILQLGSAKEEMKESFLSSD